MKKEIGYLLNKIITDELNQSRCYLVLKVLTKTKILALAEDGIVYQKIILEEDEITETELTFLAGSEKYVIYRIIK